MEKEKMGNTVFEWNAIGDALEADYEISKQVVIASRSLGNPLDITSVELAAHKMRKQLDKELLKISK